MQQPLRSTGGKSETNVFSAPRSPLLGFIASLGGGTKSDYPVNTAVQRRRQDESTKPRGICDHALNPIR